MRNRTILIGAAIVAGLLLTGASSQAQATKTAKTFDSGKPGKPAAPVEITGVVKGTTAALTITFTMAAEEVSVRVYGTDGLVVSGTAYPVTTGIYKAGQALSLPIAFTPGSGQSNLAVVVSGRFDGSLRSRVVSFTVGDKLLKTSSQSTVKIDAEGKPVIVMAAEPQ